jgi:hypothetical protein
MRAGATQAFDDPHLHEASTKTQYEPWDDVGVIQGMVQRAIAKLSNRTLRDAVNALSPMGRWTNLASLRKSRPGQRLGFK